MSGVDAPHQSGNAVIRSAPHSTIRNYAIEFSHVVFSDMAGPPGFDVIATTPGTVAERVIIDDSSFADVSGNVVAAAAETGNKGTYSADRIAFARSRFHNVGRIADVLRGGTDESTFGPSFTLARSDVDHGGLLSLSGVQRIEITGNRFTRASGIEIAHSVGTPIVRIVDNRFIATPEPKLTSLYPQGTPQVTMQGNVVESAR